MNCRLCGSVVKPWLEMPIDAMKDEVTPFQSIVRCVDCMTGMLTPQPQPDEIPEFYRLANYYTHGDSHISVAEPGFLDKVLIKLAWRVDRSQLLDAVEFATFLPTEGTVCDLGCGDGWNLKRFQQRGFQVIGVDPDPVSRDKAAEASITVLPGTAEALPAELSSRQFDFVVMTHSLEHCLDPVAALQNAFALVKPGGYFYCEVPNWASVHFETLNICSTNLDSPRHLWHFRPEGLRRVIELQGFRFHSWRFAGFTRHHLASWRIWGNDSL